MSLNMFFDPFLTYAVLSPTFFSKLLFFIFQRFERRFSAGSFYPTILGLEEMLFNALIHVQCTI